MAEHGPGNIQPTTLEYAPFARPRRWLVRNWAAFLFPVGHYCLLALAPDLARGSNNPDSSLGFILMIVVTYLADFPVSYGMMWALASHDVPREGLGYVLWLALASAYWLLIGLGVVRLVRYCRR
jgi:hypothetical protein